MLRILLQYVLPLILPFLIFLVYARLAQKPAGISDTPWIGLAAAGVGLMAVSLVTWGLLGGFDPDQTYVPARFEDGELVPGSTGP
jgi:Family of unknown function (DUF6111)